MRVSHSTFLVRRSTFNALVILGVLTVVMTFPLAFQAWGTITNYGDPLLNTWIMAWDAHKLTSDSLNLFNANIFYPYTGTLAYSENLVGNAILAAPVIWVTGNPIFAHNVIVLLSFVLSGFGAYLLVRYLTNSWYGGLVAGLIFAFSPYRFGQFSHIQLLTAQWMPFTFLYLTRYFRSRSLLDALLLALFLAWQSLSCVYYAFYTAIAVGIYLAYRGFIYWKVKGLFPDWVLLRRLGLAFVLIAVIVVPFFLPYLTAKEAVGERALEHQGGASLENYLILPKESILGRMVPFRAHRAAVEETYFPGLVVLALLAIFLKARFRRREVGVVDNPSPVSHTEPLFYLLLGVFAFVLSLGPTLRITLDGGGIFAPLPYAFLYDWIPGFKAMRVPARFAILVVFALTVLGGYGAAWLSRRWGRPLLAAVVFVLLAEYLAIPVPLRPIEVGAKIPQVYRWLNRLASETVLLELPSTTSFWFWEDIASMERLARQQYFSIYHWHRSIMGYSGFYPPLFWESIDRILNFPSTESISYLRGMGIRYLILHRAEFGREAWEAMERRLALFKDQLSLVETIGDDYIYALSGQTEGAKELQLDAYLPSAVVTGKEYTAYTIVQNPNNRAFVHRVPERYTVTYQWDGNDGMTNTGEIEGRFSLVHPEGRSFVPIALPPPPGTGATLRLAVKALGHVITAEGPVQAEDAPPETALLPPQSGRRRFLKAGLNFASQIELSHVALSDE